MTPGKLYKLRATCFNTTLPPIKRYFVKSSNKHYWRTLGSQDHPGAKIKQDESVLFVEEAREGFWEPIVVVLVGDRFFFYTKHLFNKEFEEVVLQ